MKRYNPKDIEPKWQQKWAEDKLYEPAEETGGQSEKPKKYILEYFPYPSGAAMHVGHVRNYTIGDVLTRHARMCGYNVLHPMGWDAFGLPAENYAIKTGLSPQEAIKQNTGRFKQQLTQMGFGYDWSREFASSDPDYYRWTQWFFLLLHRRGLAYRKESLQWWCPFDKTVLANEQVEQGRCWRCGNQVEKKALPQWFFKITDYADRLLDDLDDLNWTDSIKTMQRNWIGRSKGTEIDFLVQNTAANYVVLHGFTGSAQTNFLPWLKTQLEKSGASAFAPELPNTEQPDAKEQAAYVLEHGSFDESTVLVGHSYGGVTALRILEKLERPIKKLVLIAGFAEPGFLDGERNFEKTTDWSFDFEKIKQNVQEVVLLRATNDSAVPPARADFLQAKLGGTIVDFTAREDHVCGEIEPVVLQHVAANVRVFTTRADTVHGATFLVVAPEHPLLQQIIDGEVVSKGLKNATGVATYRQRALAKSDIERQEVDREKTGVFAGAYAFNPANGERIPIWVADYVLGGYGTGAVMAVPAHDERDREFADTFDLPIVDVVEPVTGTPQKDPEFRRSIVAIVRNPKTNEVLSINWGKQGGNLFIGGGREEGEDIVETAKREVAEETGYRNLELVGQTGRIHHHYFAHSKGVARQIEAHGLLFDLVDNARGEQKLEANEAGKFKVEWLPKNEAESKITEELHALAYDLLVRGNCYTGEGVMINSGKYDGLSTSLAREKISEDLVAEGVAEWRVNYKIRDWLISRQRYWGAPIPMIHCPKCGIVPVPEDQLPVELPVVRSYHPTGEGTSVLASVYDWVNTECPTCGGPAKRDTDTMDGFACSSWYFLRFVDPHNPDKPFDPEKVKRWLPVDDYIGGAEHAVMHLLYARMWTKVMQDEGLIDFGEPFKTLRNQGMILAPDGQKMSKSKGNTIEPDDLIDQGYGADAIRIMELFIGPWSQSANWSVEGMGGSFRFLQRVWTLTQELSGDVQRGEPSSEFFAHLHQTIKKVTKDLETLSFNTAIATMMEYVNILYKMKAEKAYGPAEWRLALEKLVQLLAPFAPHITEELWAQLGHKTSVHLSEWPTWDEKYLQSDIMAIVVQVNGKLRGQIEVAADASEETVLEAAQHDPKVAAHLKDKTIKKNIYVPGRLVNFVIG